MHYLTMGLQTHNDPLDEIFATLKWQSTPVIRSHQTSTFLGFYGFMGAVLQDELRLNETKTGYFKSLSVWYYISINVFVDLFIPEAQFDLKCILEKESLRFYGLQNEFTFQLIIFEEMVKANGRIFTSIGSWHYYRVDKRKWKGNLFDK